MCCLYEGPRLLPHSGVNKFVKHLVVPSTSTPGLTKLEVLRNSKGRSSTVQPAVGLICQAAVRIYLWDGISITENVWSPLPSLPSLHFSTLLPFSPSSPPRPPSFSPLPPHRPIVSIGGTASVTTRCQETRTETQDIRPSRPPYPAEKDWGIRRPS